MSFDAQGNFFHFVFANEDNYYLDGLVMNRLELQLRFCLKSEKYTGIYFIRYDETQQEKYFVEMDEVDEAQSYTKNFKVNRIKRINKIVGIGFLQKQIVEEIELEEDVEYTNKKIHDGKSDVRDGYAVFGCSEEEICERIEVMLQSNQKYAFIISIKDFFYLYHTMDRWNQLRMQSEKCKRANTSIFVLTATTNASDSLPYLINTDGVFQFGIFAGKKDEILKEGFSVYTNLKRMLNKNGYHYWGNMRQHELRNMILRGIIKRNWNIEFRFVDQYAELLYYWYHSPMFAWHVRSKIELPVERISFMELQNRLDNPNVWRQIDDWLETYHKKQGERPLRSYLEDHEYRIQEEREPLSEYPNGIYEIYDRITRFRADTLLRERNDELAWVMEGQLQDMKEMLHIVWVNLENNEAVNRKMNAFVGKMEEISRNPLRTEELVKWGMKALTYLICGIQESYQPSRNFENKMDCYDLIINDLIHIEQYQQEYKSYGKEIPEKEKEVQEAFEYLQKQKMLNPGIWAALESFGIGKNVTGDVMHMSAEEQNLGYLYKTLENLKRLRAVRYKDLILAQERLRNHKEILRKLEAHNLDTTNSMAAERKANELMKELLAAREKESRQNYNSIKEFQEMKEEAKRIRQHELSKEEVCEALQKIQKRIQNTEQEENILDEEDSLEEEKVCYTVE